MRVLSLTNCPALEHLGSGYVISGFVRGLRALGHDVDLLEPDDFEVFKWMRPRAYTYRQAVGMHLAVRARVREASYDVVEFWGGEAHFAIRRLVSHKGPRPLVVQHTNGPEPRYNRLLREAGVLKFTPLQAWYAGKLVPKAFELPDGIVTASRTDHEWLEQLQWPQSGRRLGIETPLANEFLARPPVPRDSVIGFCGTWLPKKGIGVLVPDITRILREYVTWRLVILGTGPDARVHSYFPEDVRPRIEVMPMITEKSVLAQQYERMEIFVLPSVIESFGVALTEAMACGCAPVATRVGFASSLENGRDAILMDAPDSPHLYESVKYLIANPHVRARIAREARERVQTLRWDSAVRTLAETYERWLAEYRVAAPTTRHARSPE